MNLHTLIELLCKLVDPVGTVIETANISTFYDDDKFSDTATPIILSIVNIEEDRMMKNQSLYFKKDESQDHIAKYNSSGQYLALSVIFASWSRPVNKYLDGIDKLNNILVFFQQHNSFFYKSDNAELITLESFNEKNETEKENYQRVTMETVNLGTEQLSEMWSYLGARYMPSVVYKMRLCMIHE